MNIKEIIASRIVASHFAEKPVMKKYKSSSCYVAELKFTDYSRLLKIDFSFRRQKICKEVQVLNLLQKNNISAPRIYFTGISSLHYPQYVIMEHLGQQSLMTMWKQKHVCSNEFFEEMGRVFARVHAIAFESQGFFSKNGTVKPASFASVEASHFHTFLRNLELAGGLTQKEKTRCRELFSKFRDSDEAVLCHMDFAPCHVMVNDGYTQITGLIDWEWARSSCSVADFAYTEALMFIYGYEGCFQVFKNGYQQEKKLPEDYDQIKSAYQLPRLLSILYFFLVSKKKIEFSRCKKYFDQVIA